MKYEIAVAVVALSTIAFLLLRRKRRNLHLPT